MKSTQFILLSLALSLNACSHLRTEPADAHSEAPSIAESSGAASADKNTGNGGLRNHDNAYADEDELAQTTEEDALEITSDAADPAQQIDLLQRISSGFSLPDFESKYIAQYEKWNSQHPTYLGDLFTRAEPYLYFIVEEIEKRGLPMDLVLLPAVESAYKPNAVSRSKAGGLWQFMPATGKYFGLRQDWWYDGRRDPIAATEAALDYLAKLNGMFDGDWFLTLAAYNAGPGTVQRAIKKNKRKGKKTDFKSLKLRSETIRYIPKLYALRNIIANPEKFDVELPIIANSAYFEVVELPGQIDLHAFAQASDIELAELQRLNAGFRRWASSPDGPHRLLIPSSQINNIDATLKALATAPKVKYRDHQIQSGDTLSSISQRYKVSVSALKDTNRLKGTSIRAGKTLLIPVSNPIIQNPLANSMPAGTSLLVNSAGRAENKLIHRVVAGDTLWSIAKRYQVKVAQLLSWNKLRHNQILNLDQPLLIFLNRS